MSEYHELVVEDSEFRVYKTGVIERKLKSGKWKVINNVANHNQGYNVILIKKKQYMRSTLMRLAFINIPSSKKMVMHHKDGNRLNCELSNLSMETYGSMSYYRTNTNGWLYNSKTNKFVVSITKDGVLQNLGSYETADEAYDVYLKEKERMFNDIHSSLLV